MSKVDEFWKHEEELDKKFDKEFFEDSDDSFDAKNALHCNEEKCANCTGGICMISDWSCRNKLDQKLMKFN